MIELVGQRTTGTVEIRALRGTQRSSVYRECVVPAELFRRLVTLGAARGLPSLSALDPGRPHKLDKRQSRRFAREVAAVQDSLRDAEVAGIVEVALWCAHASRGAWLTIQPGAEP